MRSRKTSSSSSKESPGAHVKDDLAPKFDRMIGLMEEQNKMMGEQGKTLKEHSKMLEALEKDATRDDKAHEGRGLKDESTWGALDKEALARLKILVDGWKDLMNVSLIFIALFLTVVTAFISPIIQLFSTPSATESKPPLPPTSLQLVALFYYLALMFNLQFGNVCARAAVGIKAAFCPSRKDKSRARSESRAPQSPRPTTSPPSYGSFILDPSPFHRLLRHRLSAPILGTLIFL
ncbi:hypothetical protein SISSUDRAFT_560881 [Sistotremastrum suecicum HHB10207 ss-3]|uniref:DUF6535 domain-containing protein n=1 Tax=Sistotremastrum suecicum HHB10207 ss-3 TaxID=1314776 RepID=A0A165XJY4_9AGAM|nr:hypothetical protein SISSUDRAFT_560881 [Sistotremastrum suecicum HHB10207 ss-3]